MNCILYFDWYLGYQLRKDLPQCQNNLELYWMTMLTCCIMCSIDFLFFGRGSLRNIVDVRSFRRYHAMVVEMSLHICAFRITIAARFEWTLHVIV